jgi:hypothetical protein
MDFAPTICCMLPPPCFMQCDGFWSFDPKAWKLASLKV